MKYRLFEGGYESFPDNFVPEEYENIVIDKLPQEIVEAELKVEKEAKEKEDYIKAIPDLVKALQEEIISLKSEINLLKKESTK